MGREEFKAKAQPPFVIPNPFYDGSGVDNIAVSSVNVWT